MVAHYEQSSRPTPLCAGSAAASHTRAVVRMGVEGKKVAFYVPRFCRAMRATLEEERFEGAAESPHVVDAPR